MSDTKISEKLDSILKEALERIDSSDTTEKLNEVRVDVLGKKGKLKTVLKGMKDVDPKDRPAVGQMVNDARERSRESLIS